MVRDKTHDEQIVRWANFVRDNPREKWKPAINTLINSQYELAAKFYKNLQNTEEGRIILERLKKERSGKLAERDKSDIVN